MKKIKKLTHAIGMTISNDEKLAFLFHRIAVLYDTENFSEIWSFKEEVGHFSPIKEISNSDNYYSYNEKDIIILDNWFKIKSRAPVKVDYAFKPVLCSKEGKYIASVKRGINLYRLKGLDFISNHFVKGAIDAAFIDGDKKMIAAARSGSYVLEIEKGDGRINELE